MIKSFLFHKTLQIFKCIHNWKFSFHFFTHFPCISTLQNCHPLTSSLVARHYPLGNDVYSQSEGRCHKVASWLCNDVHTTALGEVFIQGRHQLIADLCEGGVAIIMSREATADVQQCEVEAGFLAVVKGHTGRGYSSRERGRIIAATPNMEAETPRVKTVNLSAMKLSF